MNPSLPDTIARMKAEILADIEAGRVPATVSSFSELHDYVDANCYGGFCDDDYLKNVWGFDGFLSDDDCPDDLHITIVNFTNEVQNAIHAWLVSGGHRRPPFNPEGLSEQVAKLAVKHAATQWCYMTLDGRTFYVPEFAARKMQARSGGLVWPPERIEL